MRVLITAGPVYGSLPTVPYAPPGTVRDNAREIHDWMEGGFNIEGHGCVLPAE